jgi:hypothetical protein
MKPLIETLRNLTKKHKENIDKARKIAENQIRAAEAAKQAAQKK